MLRRRMAGRVANYWDYIRVEDLLALQSGFEDDEGAVADDEVLFIVVHQIYELWFKLVIRELSAVRDLFAQNPVPDQALSLAVRKFRRITVIFEQAQQHFRVMETLTTRDYLGFRDRLVPASGFQSAQLREIEILLGLDESARVPMGTMGYRDALKDHKGEPSPAAVRVEARVAAGPSLKAVLFAWLARTPIDGSPTEEAAVAFLERFVRAHRAEAARRVEMVQASVGDMPAEDLARLRERHENDARAAEAFLLANDDPNLVAGDPVSEAERARRRHVRAAIVFLESYRELPRLAWAREVVDAVLEMEQAMLVWRQRHARMVERVIGRRTGTGGSAGVDYLDQTALRYRIFGDLWAVRTLLLQRSSLPPLEHEGDYRFKVED